jgi:hypothetical protein
MPNSGAKKLNYRPRGITQKKSYDIQNRAKVWTQESDQYFGHGLSLGKRYVNCVSRKIWAPWATFRIFSRTLLYSEIGKYNFNYFNCFFVNWFSLLRHQLSVNPLRPGLNPSAQRRLPRFFIGILIFKGLTARLLYKSFGVKGVIFTLKYK